MSINVRYRLIQIVEILLWLGAAAGLGQIASRLWAIRSEGWRAMLDLAVPGLLGIGAGMAALIVLIGIYHNTRRQGEALDRLAKQGATGMRRLPGAARGETVPTGSRGFFNQPAQTYAPGVPYEASSAHGPAQGYAPQQPAPVAPVQAPVTAPAPAAVRPKPVVVQPAPVIEPAPVIPHAAPAPAPEPVAQDAEPAAVTPNRAAPPFRAGTRRLGPAN